MPASAIDRPKVTSVTLVLSKSDLRSALTTAACMEALAAAHAELDAGRTVMPVRTYLHHEEAGGRMAVMPAILLDSNALGVKLQCTYPGNAANGMSPVSGVVILMDGATGHPVAIMDSSTVTEIRTAAASALATRYLAREGAHTLAVLGAGVQARAHIRAMRAVRPVDGIRIWSRTRAGAERLAAEAEAEHGLPVTVTDGAEEAVRGADLICVATRSGEPVLRGAWLAPGAHVNAVGAFTAATRELDSDAIAAAHLVVDSRAAVEQESGDILIPVQEGRIGLDHVRAELGELVVGTGAGRESEDEITVYKSLGVGIQDVAAAAAAHAEARRLGLGTDVEL
jgi:alanine dehydrogenase